ncbi:tripartite motif-containing protein 16-like protein isoform X2 [Xyrauchen texanus]|uniref:tripartite motif-containing protein 16-like protein isoform X2 n=1 Tax=Xyrauchen texanus TaxID=154827 RepID=UPI002242B699|nr:tripartite motif-containing protein 16-like protein isoform X2 [Xyrauchen texanus]
MAGSSISVDQNQFCCPACLYLLNDPVTIPCGHSYCMNCITDCFDDDHNTGIYKCLLCRQTFTTRPALSKNIILADMVEKLKTRSQATRPADVECDVCPERNQKAVKSCWECQNSYCQNHLEQHEMFYRGKRHNLTDVNGRLQETTQPQDKNTLEMSASAEQQQVKEIQIQLQQRILKKLKEGHKLREAVMFYKRYAQRAVEDYELIFTELISSIERSRSEVTQLIRDQEKAAVSRAEELLKRLEQEIVDLSIKEAQMQRLSHTDDHINSLLNLQSLSLSGSSDSIIDTSYLSYDDVVKSVTQFRDKLKLFCREETEKISTRVKSIQVIFTPEYETRAEFLQCFRHFTLDANTLNGRLRLSEGNTVVAETGIDWPYPDHPDRFDCWSQVLCKECVSGCCYWEVEWSGNDGVDIAVAYKSIRRKGAGKEVDFGFNSQSWRLFCSPSSYSFAHNNIETELPLVSSSSRIGVYVDHSAGVLSFYSVSDTMNLIHRVQTTFTQPLYPGIGLYNHTTAKLCHPKI